MPTPREAQVAHALVCGSDCDGRGWPHEWDPEEMDDDCVLCGTIVVKPYVRWGSGYAHQECV